MTDWAAGHGLYKGRRRTHFEMGIFQADGLCRRWTLRDGTHGGRLRRECPQWASSFAWALRVGKSASDIPGLGSGLGSGGGGDRACNRGGPAWRGPGSCPCSRVTLRWRGRSGSISTLEKSVYPLGEEKRSALGAPSRREQVVQAHLDIFPHTQENPLHSRPPILVECSQAHFQAVGQLLLVGTITFGSSLFNFLRILSSCNKRPAAWAPR